MKKNISKCLKKNNSGFIVADFLFSFTLVLAIGIFIFGLTFSLATIEIAQYIVWSTARNYAAANVTEAEARNQALTKFRNLTAQFPLLTGNGASGDPWFELTDSNVIIGNLATIDPEFNITSSDKINDFRQPWTGAKGKINLKLFSSLQIPFLGPVAEDKSLFEFPIRAFLIRHPSRTECWGFFYGKRYTEGIKKLENNQLAPSSGPGFTGASGQDGWGEDNGC